LLAISDVTFNGHIMSVATNLGSRLSTREEVVDILAPKHSRASVSRLSDVPKKVAVSSIDVNQAELDLRELGST
jgi:hypothetical protein